MHSLLENKYITVRSVIYNNVHSSLKDKWVGYVIPKTKFQKQNSKDKMPKIKFQNINFPKS